MTDVELGLEKFSTCIYRSREEIPYGVVPCCGKKEVKPGYICWNKYLNIEGVTPEICQKCVYYAKRSETNNSSFTS